ncbi:hypothetical protein AC579_4328 [Pseudocercospora musae]|uniref:Uncharacterized protein n=1 Tax=Pseudocercospora musae TaxID=113226 RepID=A0A139IQH2_9PEZI|nr:hypothetical protein AC579_4328 [Pseudocercospora musae]
MKSVLLGSGRQFRADEGRMASQQSCLCEPKSFQSRCSITSARMHYALRVCEADIRCASFTFRMSDFYAANMRRNMPLGPMLDERSFCKTFLLAKGKEGMLGGDSAELGKKNARTRWKGRGEVEIEVESHVQWSWTLGAFAFNIHCQRSTTTAPELIYLPPITKLYLRLCLVVAVVIAFSKCADDRALPAEISDSGSGTILAPSHPGQGAGRGRGRLSELSEGHGAR